MTAEQRAPLAAFFALLIASVVVLGHAMRTDAMGSLFVAPAQTVISGARLAPIPQQLLAAGVAAVARDKAEEAPAVIIDQVVTHIVAVGAARSVGAPHSGGAKRPSGRAGAGSGAVLQQPVQAITATLTTTPGLTAGVLTGTTQIVSTVSDGVVSSVGAPASSASSAATAPLGVHVASFGSPVAGATETAPVQGSATSTSSGWSGSYAGSELPTGTDRGHGDRTHLSRHDRDGWKAPVSGFAVPHPSQQPSSSAPHTGWGRSTHAAQADPSRSDSKAPVVTVPTPSWSRGHGSTGHGSPSSSHSRGYGSGYGHQATPPPVATSPSHAWSAFGQQGDSPWGRSPFSSDEHGR